MSAVRPASPGHAGVGERLQRGFEFHFAVAVIARPLTDVLAVVHFGGHERAVVVTDAIKTDEHDAASEARPDSVGTCVEKKQLCGFASDLDAGDLIGQKLFGRLMAGDHDGVLFACRNVVLNSIKFLAAGREVAQVAARAFVEPAAAVCVGFVSKSAVGPG